MDEIAEKGHSGAPPAAVVVSDGHTRQGYMMTKLTILALVLTLVGGCANITARGDPPKNSWTTDQAPEAVAGCLVPSMNEVFKDVWGAPDITHHVQTIAPDQIYEVLPQRELVYGGGDLYYVRLTRTEAGSLVELFGISGWDEDVRPAVESCV